MSREENQLLLVDDQPLTRFATKVIAEKLGYQVDEADSGAGALAKLRHKQYQLILLDYDMPSMNGAQTAVAIRRMENFHGCSTAIFCLSAREDRDTERKCLEAGMDGFLRRPCTAEKLVSALEKWSAGASQTEDCRSRTSA